MDIPPLLILLLALPVLLAGERILRAVPPLARLNVPTPVVGGFCVAAIVLVLHLSGALHVRMQTQTTAPWWTFWVTTHAQWRAGEPKSVILPLLVVFYTTSASARRGNWSSAAGCC